MQIILTKLSVFIGTALQVVILVLLVKRHLWKRLFWFVVYIAYEIVESVLRVSFVSNRDLYFAVYWATEVGDVFLTVLAVRECFLNVFWAFTRLRWFPWIVRSLVGLALLYAAWITWSYPPVQANFRVSTIIRLELGVNYILAAVGVLYFAMIRLLRIRGHQRESGIMLGFCLNVSVAIAGFLVRSVFGTKLELVSGSIVAVAYLVAELIWVAELSRTEREITEPKSDLTPEEMERRLDAYIRLLQRFLRGK